MYYNKILGAMVGNVVSSIRGILFDIFCVPFPKPLEKYHTIIYNIAQQCNSAPINFANLSKNFAFFVYSIFMLF